MTVGVAMGCCHPPGQLCEKGSELRVTARLAERALKVAAADGSDLIAFGRVYQKALADFAQHLDLTRSQAEAVLRG